MYRLISKWLNPVAHGLGLLGVILFFFSANALAAQVKLAWDPISGASGYRVHYGTASGNYNAAGSPLNVVGSTTTSVTIPDSTTYYFAVKGYSSAQESGYSNEVNNPIAQFGANTTSGLTVQFTDQSTGTITARKWEFGDSTTSSEINPTKNYTNPGDYPVTLTVTGMDNITTHKATKTIKVIRSLNDGAAGTQLYLHHEFHDGSGAIDGELYGVLDRQRHKSDLGFRRWQR